MKSIILARVSSKEQEEGYSLQAQVGRLTELAKRKGFEVIKTFEIIESSTTGNRRKFHEMLKFCEAQKEPIAICADAVDRVQRSFKESIILNELVQKGKIELHFYMENLTISAASKTVDIMMWDFSVMRAKSYVLALRENVMRSIDYKIQSGEWVAKAPLGYENYRNENGKSDIRIVPDVAYKVKKLFEIYAIGKLSLKELAIEADKIGLKSSGGKKLQEQTIHKIIKNPFYYGEMEVKGKIYPHKYEPLLSKDLWDRCQAVRTGANKKPYKYADKPFLFRGLIRCVNSGKICTTDQKKGKYNYIMYWDAAGKKKWVREEVIENTVADILDTIVIPEKVIFALEKDMKQHKEQEVAYRESEIRNIQRELATARTRIDNLFNLYVDGKIDDDMYQAKMPELKATVARLENNIKAHQKADDAFNETVICLMKIANKVGTYFRQSSNLEHRRTILKTIIRTLEINNGKVGYSLHFPFSEMQNCTSQQLWRPQRESNPRYRRERAMS